MRTTNYGNKNYVYFTDDQKQRANSVDLEDYLKSKGETLEKSGREKRLKSNKSVTVRGNTWFDHSTEKGGYAIDFVQKFYGLAFPDAVIELIGEQNNTLTPAFKTYEKKEEPPKPFELPPKNSDMKRAFAYLSKHRCIDYSVLTFFAKQNLIYESKELSKDGLKEYHNAVFVGYDENGVGKHGHKRSIYSEGKKFMMNLDSSNPKHSFHYLGSRASTGKFTKDSCDNEICKIDINSQQNLNSPSNRLYVFEAPIDLLSFISMYKNTNWQKHNYVALCGVSSQAMIQLLDTNENLTHVVLCMDNDKAGHSASKRFEELLAERNITFSRIVPTSKDFNEDLQIKQTQINEQQPVMAMG